MELGTRSNGDHIGDVLAYVRTLDGENDPVRIEGMWLNTFQDLLAESDARATPGAAWSVRYPERPWRGGRVAEDGALLRRYGW